MTVPCTLVLCTLVLCTGCPGGGRNPATPEPVAEVCREDHVVVGSEGMTKLSGCRTVAASLELRGAGYLDLAELANLEVVEGNLTIGPTFGLDVVNLDGLREVRGTLKIVSNAVATGVYLPALERAARIEIAANVGVAGIAMPALRSVTGDLVIAENPALENLGLGSLQKVGGTLRIAENRELALVEIGQVEATRFDVTGEALPPDVVDRLK